MRNQTSRLCVAILLLIAAAAPALAADKKMPREDVIDVPAVGEGLCVHNLFQSNMVLQRDKPISVWGWAAPGEKVTVSFAGQTGTATAGKDRAWKVTLPAMPANSTPQKMTVKGKDKTLTLDNILIGDVWVLGGQSNMEFPIANVEYGSLEIASANFPEIRILTVPSQNGPDMKKGFPRLHEWSGWFSRHFRKGDWDVCTPETVRDLSAIGYVFARRLQMASQVPIGVIDASRGGTTVETWTPMSVLKKIDTPEVKDKLAEWDEKVAAFDPEEDLKNQIKRHEDWVARMKKEGKQIPADRKAPTEPRPGPAMDQNRPGNCYASMIAPIAGFPVKGAIFHQGFNNALGGGSAGAAMYYQIFGKMIESWREAFGDPQMPFGIISLCTAGEPQSLDDYLEQMYNDGIYIREAQYKTFLDFLKAGDENVGFVSSFDQRRKWYHPQKKVIVGERAAIWALATEYDMKFPWQPPMLTDMNVEDGKLILKLDSNVQSSDEGPIRGFAIAGKDRHFQPADAQYLQTGTDSRNRPQYDRKTIVLSSPHVPNPIHFRYAWGRNPLANLTRADQIPTPFATQRSDDWKQEEVPNDFGFTGDPNDRRRISGEARKALRLDDMERRLKDAQAFIDENKEKYEKDRAAEKAAEEKRKAEQAKASE